MAVGYIIQKKNINVGYNPGEKYVAKIFKEKPITQKKIAHEIANSSAMTVGDVYNMLQAIQEKIAQYLSEGIPIKLDLLGIFTPGISAKAVDTLEEVTPDTIERIYVRFNPTVDLKEVITKSGVKYIDLNIKGIQFRGETPVNP